MTLDINNKPAAGDVVLNGKNHNGVQPGDGTAFLDGGLSFNFLDENRWLSLSMFLIPVIDDIVSAMRACSVAGIMMPGPLNSRMAARYRRQMEAACDKLAGAVPGVEPRESLGDIGLGKSLYPDSIEADEGARDSAIALMQKAADRAGDIAAQGALDAAGIGWRGATKET